ncbi:MAG: TMEM175 family protein [Stellaceae bacterium]
MVLELTVPRSAGIDALGAVVPVFLSYVLSFAYVGIYWNNHHHFFTWSAMSMGWCCGRTCTSCSGCRSSRLPPAGWARTISPRCRPPPMVSPS